MDHASGNSSGIVGNFPGVGQSVPTTISPLPKGKGEIGGRCPGNSRRETPSGNLSSGISRRAIGKKSRTKGQVGEREIAALIADTTGWEVRRRVRQHEGDSDLDGVPGWSVEVKRCAKATRSVIVRWWAQTVAQSKGALPVLFYRLDQGEWRAVWPVACGLAIQTADMWSAYEWTAEGSVAAWAAVARERLTPTLPAAEAA